MNELVEIAVTEEQIEVIKQTVCAEATDSEMKLFFYDCARNGVHPLDRLIHFTKRGGRYVPVTSIDLFRIRAESTGEYAGQDDAVFTGDEKRPGFKASVTVYRNVNGQRIPVTASARWEEYLPSSASMWTKMPHTMLAKCAEALALRKAFPKQLHGLYTKDEMEQADRKSVATPQLKGATTTEHLRALVETPTMADADDPMLDAVIPESAKPTPKPPEKKAEPPKPAIPRPAPKPDATPADEAYEYYMNALNKPAVLMNLKKAEAIITEACGDPRWDGPTWKAFESYYTHAFPALKKK